MSVTKCPHIRVQVYETEFEALLDSGAGISAINVSSLAEQYSLKVQSAAVCVSSADGTEYRCSGYLNIPFTYKGITKIVPTKIVPQISRSLILGANFLESFGIQPMIGIGNEPERVETLNEVAGPYLCFNIEPFSLLRERCATSSILSSSSTLQEQAKRSKDHTIL